MSYCTQQDLITRFGADELGVVANDGVGGIDENAIGRAIDDASALINGWIQAQYALPLATVPPLLNLLACDIARYQLHDQNAGEEIRNRYNDALKTLKDIASTKLKLGLGGGESAAKAAQAITVESIPAMWSRRNSGGFI
jgi:phage gp36-like protein